MNELRLIYRGAYPKLVCCQVIVREMPNGDFLAFFQTGGPVEPHPDNRVYVSRSQDRGDTWDEPMLWMDFGERAVTLTEVYVHGGAARAFFYTHNGRQFDWQNYYCTSVDSGHTWRDVTPMPCLPRFSVIRGLVTLPDGAWLLPYQRYEEGADFASLDAAGKTIGQSELSYPKNGALLSADQGKTWTRSGETRVPVDTFFWNENAVACLGGARLAMLIRTNEGCLYRADSADGGRTWSPAAPTDIPNPSAKIRLFNLPDGRVALLHNPNPKVGMRNRNPLSLWISDDGMRTFKDRRDLVTFPGALSYPDGFVDQDGKTLHYGFDYNRHDAIYGRVTL